MKKIIKTVILIVAVPLIGLAGLIIYSSVTDYKPKKIVNVFKADNDFDQIEDSTILNLMIWNIGYCGLGADMDFFYDGGEQVRTSEENVFLNLNAVKEFILKNNNIDFWLFQEIDKDSKRSYYINQYKAIDSLLNEYTGFFGKNYDVGFVPQPFTDPMGKVVSGLATFSELKPITSDRYSFPGNYDFPVSLFMLDRCFLVNRYKVKNGKELIVINTHNSAYDDGSLKAEQMKFLQEFLQKEYENGNYIIVGGDWNQCPPNFKTNFANHIFDDVNVSYIDENYLSEAWQWVYSNNIPTNRRVKTTYKKGKTATTVIDFYLISPNLKLLNTENIDLDFQNSDHQPVRMQVQLQ